METNNLDVLKQKNDFYEKIKKAMESQKHRDDISLYIVDSKGIDQNCICDRIPIKDNKILFELSFHKEEVFKDTQKCISVYFENTKFTQAVSFKDLTLETLSFKEVTFEKNVGIKDVKIDNLILRPYEINGHIVVNVDGNAKDGIIVKNKKTEDEKHYINKIEFEDPHITNNAKIYFIGTEFQNGNFTNRNLENVIFQNCDFENTYFLNSFLDKTIFLNCKFPTIRNDNNTLLLAKLMWKIVYWIFALSISFFLSIYTYNLYVLVFLIMLMLPTFYYFIVDKVILNLLNKIFKEPKEHLINHHIGIADERKLIYEYLNNDAKGERKDKLLTYEFTMNNISSIYNDIKVNFKNVSNFQQSGDFYYAQNLTKINLSTRPFDMFLLKLSFMINGFGERYVRSLILIIITLFVIGSIQKPNVDYISTPATPSFLLDVKHNETSSFQVTDYSISNFLVISKVLDYDKKDIDDMYESIPAYDNRFDFKYNEQKVPKIKQDSFWVNFYYATSHITAPFTQENKKWFQNMSEKSHSISFVLTIFIWLCFAGMITAIFNRIRR